MGRKAYITSVRQRLIYSCVVMAMATTLPYILASIIPAFIVTYKLTPRMIERLRVRGITGVDVHKVNKPRVPEMGGVVIMAGYLTGILTLLTLQQGILPQLLAALSAVLMVCMVGMMDDVLGLSQRTRTILPILASLPLITILGGDRTMLVPFLGSVYLGMFYPLILVPIGFTAASNLVNLLAGFNGLEAGMGAIATASLTMAALLSGHSLCAYILAPMLGALIAFFIYNRYPAKIFPGNSGTYSIGGAIAAAVILGDMEVVGAVCLMPYIIEFFIKARTRFKGQCFGVVNPDGTLSPMNPIQSLAHLVMKRGGYTEARVVKRLLLIEALFGASAVVIAYFSLYYILFRL